MAELLLDHRANIEAQNWGGYTPLHHAVKYKQVEMGGIVTQKRGLVPAAYNELGPNASGYSQDER